VVASPRFDDLVSIGLTPNKSRRMKLPLIPEIFISDFIRGYFDGDGSIWSGLTHSKRKKKTSALLVCFTSASISFLSDLLLLLKKKGIVGGSLFASKTGNYARINLSTKDALKLAEIMYNVPHSLYLQRKKSVFVKFLKMRS
jgi:intein/homing endonuclease